MCYMLNLSKSGYYNWVNTPIGPRAKQQEELDIMIKDIFEEHKSRYGSTRIFKELKGLNIPCTRRRISKRMASMGLIAKARRKFKATTDSNHKKSVAQNILNQNFSAYSTNQKWVSDITYIPTKEGWLYLCVFIDLYSRSVVGWSMSDRMKADLVVDALTMSLFRRKFPTGVIVHSDKGSQYASNKYQELLESNGLICSMSGVGCCYDNAPSESFFHSLKVELVHDENYQTREIAKSSIVEYIECYYNRKRRHSAIDYNIPTLYENTYVAV
jgi:putative transposase